MDGEPLGIYEVEVTYVVWRYKSGEIYLRGRSSESGKNVERTNCLSISLPIHIGHVKDMSVDIVSFIKFQ